MSEPTIDVMPSEDYGVDKRFLKLPNNEILFKPPFTMACIGAIGAGKTSFAWTLFNKLYKNYYDEFIVISGTADSKDTWEKVNQRSVLFLNDFDDEAMRDYISDLEKTQEERKAKGKFPLRVCLLLDDIIFQGYNRNRVGVLENLLMTCRHYNITVCLLLQHTKMISAAMRNQIFVFCVFRLTAVDLEKFAEEHSNLLTQKEFKEMYNDIQKKGPHEYLIVNYKKDMNNRFSHRFTTPIDISQYKV
jgi:GTPase SAR1 family protein